MKDGTPLMHKTPHSRTNFGSYDVEKNSTPLWHEEH